MLSGAGCPVLPGVRIIPDGYLGKGPLGGLHACLRAAHNSSCLAVSVDTPLIPAAVLAYLCRSHRSSVIVLRHWKREEPLLGVYDRCAADAAFTLIGAGKYAVRALKDIVCWNCFDYSGPEELLVNCNTPEDFAAAKEIAEAYASVGLPI